MDALELYPHETRPGPANMARDDVLLARAVAGVAGLRFYEWSRPTVSLGYFQPTAALGDVPRLTALPAVRRATGGAAILHGDGDLTYALAVPLGVPPPDGASWVCRVHHAIAAALRTFGVAAKAVVCGEEKKLGPVLCFLDRTPGDLLVGGHKVVGSAQRKVRGAVLQHGTIRLAAARALPTLPGVKELTGATVPPGALATVIVEALGWRTMPTAWTAEDARAAERIAEERYANPAWNRKR